MMSSRTRPLIGMQTVQGDLGSFFRSNQKLSSSRSINNELRFLSTTRVGLEPLRPGEGSWEVELLDITDAHCRDQS